MFKLFRFALPLILALLVLPACKKQPPTPVIDNAMGGPSSYDNGEIIDFIPPQIDDGSQWGEDINVSEFEGTGLVIREEGEGTAQGAGTWNGRPTVRGQLGSVYFGFDSFSISASERSKLQAAANHLNANPGDGLLIEGYCDWYGTADYNLALGDRRANSALDYLSTLGISGSRIDTLSKGSLESTPGLSKSESGQDRRAELVILK